MTEKGLKEQMKTVRDLRIKTAELKERKKRLLEAFEKENEELFLAVKMESETLVAAEEYARALAIVEFDQTGEKQLYAGIVIKQMSRLRYLESTAMAWAKEHGMALKLDVKAFEKIAKADKVYFVYYDTENTAALPKEIKIEGETQ